MKHYESKWFHEINDIGQSASQPVSQSASRSVSQCHLGLSPSGTHDQILAVVNTVAVLSWGVFPDGRTGFQLTVL
jgi:hypothetical protein